MDELVAKLAAYSELDPDTARKAIIIAFKYMLNDGPTKKTEAIIDQVPGLRDAIDGSDLGGTPGMMGIYADLTALNLGMPKIQALGEGFVKAMRETVDPAAFDEVASSVPGLASFV